ncbi:heme biosynthesis HemY N-terminal domain-containing protein [Agarivorans sp. 1_MG-2023]|uniref:heme biosynthesis HemY N-terminal domain-containing protein n=1 Tax=Agarivorans sp. 1_MG-2023 TaxID=3062634 RepID=UPI0026E384F9|nr:heme biosynthesis HemY N-terminal domain-containing protein [Agarivorans sp. 1_MG-2023]MDO6764389.1 heme biosynthesis HemY N-terminal domain-containing protein [Agarivorans sp. 1_MG-2023]
MFKILILLVCIAIGLALGPQLAGNKGYVLIAFDNYTIEMSVTSALFLSFICFCVLLLSLWVARWLWLSFSRSGAWWGHRRKQKAINHTQQGMLAMMRGDYQHAEKLVSKAATYSDAPALNYLTAAEAAQEQGQDKKRDKYLEQATRLTNNDSAVLITQARLQLKQQNYSAALSSIEQLPHDNLKQAAIKRMQMSIFPALGLWQRYIDLLPLANKAGLIDNQHYQSELSEAYKNLFLELANSQGSDAVATHWNGMPRKQKKQMTIAAAACRALITSGDNAAAYQLLGDLLNRNADSELLEVAAELKLSDPHPLLQQLTGLIRKHPNNADLLCLIGQLHSQQQQWSEAKERFEQSIKLAPNSLCYQGLAEVHRQLDEPEQAIHYYRQALSN